MEVYLSILFLPHLCQQSNYYHTISRWTKNSNNIWTVNPPILAPPLMGRCSGQPLKGFWRHKNWGVCQCEVGRSANDHWQYIGKNIGLVPSVLDSQSLGAGFNARTEVYLSILFLPHLCQQSNYYHTNSILQVHVVNALL